MSIYSIIFAVGILVAMKRIVLSMISVVLLSGCVTQTSQQATGTIVGLQLGSVVGRAVGAATGDSWSSGTTGAAIGAVAGAMLGNTLNAPKKKSTEADAVASSAKKSKQDRRREQMLQAIEKASQQSDVTVGKIQFLPANGDNTLYEGECAKLSFDIINNSDRTIATVDPLVVCSNRNIEISPMKRIEKLLPGEVVRYTVSIVAKKLRSGTASFIVKLSIDGGEYKVMMIDKIATEK